MPIYASVFLFEYRGVGGLRIVLRLRLDSRQLPELSHRLIRSCPFEPRSEILCPVSGNRPRMGMANAGVRTNTSFIAMRWTLATGHSINPSRRLFEVCGPCGG